MAEYHLYKWSVVISEDPYQAPETNHQRLRGYRDSENRAVKTSPLIKVDGRKITTQSGNIYILEDIDANYLKWMQDNGYEYNPENPIKDKRNRGQQS